MEAAPSEDIPPPADIPAVAARNRPEAESNRHPAAVETQAHQQEGLAAVAGKKRHADQWAPAQAEAAESWFKSFFRRGLSIVTTSKATSPGLRCYDRFAHHSSVCSTPG